MKTWAHLWQYLAESFLEWEMFQTKMHRKSKHILYSVTLSRKSCRLWEKVEKIILEPDKPQMTIWRMRTACWITKARDTLRICKSYYFSTATMVKRTRLNVALYAYFLSFLLSPCLDKRKTVAGFLKEQICTSSRQRPYRHWGPFGRQSNQCKGLFASDQGGQKFQVANKLHLVDSWRFF